MVHAPHVRSLPRALFLALSIALASCAATEALIRKALSQGELADGLQVGEWTYWYENGAKKAQGHYQGDHQIGQWTYWHPNGVVEWEGRFDENRIHGTSVFYYDNGQPRAKGEFVHGLEEGVWRFWNKDGELQMMGDFVAGRPSLRWTWYHEGGAVLAQGYEYKGERIGLWQFWEESGQLYERSFGMRDDLAIVNEAWDNGHVSREGYVQGDVPVGRWITYHENGRRRALGDFNQGRATGYWTFWSIRGELLAQGRLERGRFVGDWDVWYPSGKRTRSGSAFPTPETHTGPFTDGSRADAEPLESVISDWVAEAGSRVEETIDMAPTPGVDGPTDELLVATDRQPVVPLRPQPWTVQEEQALDYLVQRYKEGEDSAVPPPGSRYGRRRAQRRANEPKSLGDLALSEPLVDKPLPWTKFYRGDGDALDIDDYRGKYVVLVVLRGFAREVCVYCVTQTEALAQSQEKFGELGSEVFCIYPGSGDRLEAFKQAYADVTAFEGEIPIGVLYDPDHRLVTEMGIEAELAIPSTFILDPDGIVRYAYVGTTIEDRPPAKAILEAIQEMVSN